MQRELKEHKEQASKIKTEYAAYNKGLQDKLVEFRNEKKAWMAEAAAMRAADKEAKVCIILSGYSKPDVRMIQDTFAAQGKLLAKASMKVFQLETKIKENKHKVDRLRDYERQVDQLVNLQRLWLVIIALSNN